MNLSMTRSLAPIVLFAYNRPLHTRKVIESLSRNQLSSESHLIVFLDGPKTQKDTYGVEETFNTVKTFTNFKSLKIYRSEINLGLSRSVVSGINKVLESFEKVIVLEDDIVVGKFFLKYMNDALEQYKFDDDVSTISGYVYPMRYKMPETFFLHSFECWGWGTWGRAWKLYIEDTQQLINSIQTQDLDFTEFGNPLKMLKDQLDGKVDSWAVRWQASLFLQKKLTLYPKRSLVQNIGFDNSGTHSNFTVRFKVRLFQEEIKVEKIPTIENAKAKEHFEEYFNENFFWINVKDRVYKILYILKNPF